MLGFKIYGYLLTFGLTAIMFILSGYLLSFIDDTREKFESLNSAMFTAMKRYWMDAWVSRKIFSKNKKISLLTIAIILTTIVQILGNSYYGVYIYEHFKNQYFGGFLNVALVFVIALIASISGTLLSKTFSKSLGEAPMLVFGTLLIALLPITLYFNPHLYSIGLATALSVVGGAIVGVAQGLIGDRLMKEDEFQKYFSSIGVVSIIPLMVLVTIGAWIANSVGLSILFLIIAIMLVFVIMPLYFTIVLIVDSEYRKERSKHG
jgi:hypothetical protein